MDGGAQESDLPGFGGAFVPGTASAGPPAPAPGVDSATAASWVPSTGSAPHPGAPGPAEGPAGAPGRKRRARWAVPVAVAVLIAGGAGIGVAVSSRSGGPTPDHAVLTAARASLAAKTADLSLSMDLHVTVQGQNASLTASGTGAVDMDAGSSELTATYGGLPRLRGMQIHEIMAGGQLYLQFSGGPFAQAGLADQWVSTPLGAGASADGGLSQSDPSGMLQALAAQGDTVTPTGQTRVDGVSVDTYHVAIDKAAVQRRIAAEGLPAAVTQGAQHFLSGTDLSLDVAVDPATSTVRQVTVNLDGSLSALQLSGTVVEDFSNYGAPVTITPPPADQVVSLQQFAQQAASGATT